MSQETKYIQISLHTTLSAIALQKDIGILDDTSSLISSFTSPSQSRQSTPSLFRGSNGIPLHLADWARRAKEQPQSSDDGRKKACKIFELFVEAGTGFGLQDTPCIKKLQKAIDVCNNHVSKKDISMLPRAERIVQHTRAKAPTFTANLRNFVVEEIPIFNVLEAMCWVYTCCIAADEIRTDRDAECYLYQLMLIFEALKASKWLGADIPTTVAAAWNKPSDNVPLTVAFACSCVG